MTEQEITNLANYFKKLFNNAALNLKPLGNKKDVLEVYKAEEFIGTVYRQVEEGETSYNFTMVILDIDLD